MCKVQLCSLMGRLVEQKETLVSEQVQDQLSELQQDQLNQLLQSYEEVLKEVNTLPPVRSHDHKIVLKDGTDPV